MTDRVRVCADGTMAVYRYASDAAEVYRVPLLLVMPPTNRGSIFDLPGRSLVGFLTGRGYDVYMLDWNPPHADQVGAGLAAYVDGFVAGAAAAVRADSGEARVSLLGYCMGGVLALLHAARAPDGVANLVALTTPLDFAGFTVWRDATDARWLDIDAVAGAVDIVSSAAVYAMFDALRPTARLAGAIRLLDRGDDPNYLATYDRLDRWSADMLPLPGALARDIVVRLLRDNALFERTLDLNGVRVDLSRVVAPFLHVVAGDDRIVPPAATAPLLARIGAADKAEIVVPGGHVMLLAGADAEAVLWPALDRWLAPRSV